MLADDVDRLFADLFGGGSRGPADQGRAAVDVYLTDDDPPELTVELDVAGVDPDEVEVVLEGQVLIVRGERRRSDGCARRSYQHAEIPWGPFERRLRLNITVDAARARADYQRGILRIRLPLAPRPPTRRVTIHLGGPA